jgi:F-type H+-transporting ATPase subunit alpha
MEINPSEVTKILKEQIKNFGEKTEVTEVGQGIIRWRWYC